jgi:hypothetical protein
MEFKSYKPVEKKELKIDIQQDDKIKKRSDKKEINIFSICVSILLYSLILANCILIIIDNFETNTCDNARDRCFEYTLFISIDIVIISIITENFLYNNLRYNITFLMISRITFSIAVFYLYYKQIFSCNIYSDHITKILYVDIAYSFVIDFVLFVFICVKICK